MPRDPTIHAERRVYEPREVFTNGPDVRNYVDRGESGEKFRSALEMPGQPACLVGPDGAGKTTMGRFELGRPSPPRVLQLPCAPNRTLDDLLHGALRRMGPRLASTREVKVRRADRTLDAKLYRGRRGSSQRSELQYEHRSERANQRDEFVDAVTANGTQVVVEDLHLLAVAEQQAFGPVLLAMRDAGGPPEKRARLVFTTRGLAPEVLDSYRGLGVRLPVIQVSPLSDAEAVSLMNSAFELLGATISEQTALTISAVSEGNGQVIHDLALELCLQGHVEQTGSARQRLGSKPFRAAMARYASVWGECSAEDPAGIVRYFAGIAAKLRARADQAQDGDSPTNTLEAREWQRRELNLWNWLLRWHASDVPAEAKAAERVRTLALSIRAVDLNRSEVKNA